MHLEQTLCWHSWHWCRRFKNNMNLVFVQRKQRLPLMMSLLRSGGKLSSLARDKALRIWVSSECDKVRVGEAFSAWKSQKRIKTITKNQTLWKIIFWDEMKRRSSFLQFQFTIKWPNIIIITQDLKSTLFINRKWLHRRLKNNSRDEKEKWKKNTNVLVHHEFSLKWIEN